MLVVWTVVVWVSRFRNVLADDDLSAAGTTWRIVVVVVFVALAGWVLIDGRRLVFLVVWTVGFWLVRGIGIIIDDHDLGFTLVHTVLMVLSIGIAAWAWLARDR